VQVEETLEQPRRQQRAIDVLPVPVERHLVADAGGDEDRVRHPERDHAGGNQPRRGGYATGLETLGVAPGDV
jgi:hypothetical protein